MCPVKERTECPSWSLMASNLPLRLYPLRVPSRPSSPIPDSKTPCHFPSLAQQTHLPLSLQQKASRRVTSTTRCLSQSQELPATSLAPPSTREEAILQAKTSLSTTLQKPLNNSIPLPTKKLRKQRQPRVRVEIPVIDESPSSLTQLAFDVFSDIPITKKGAKPTILILWPDRSLLDSAHQAFTSCGSPPNSVLNSDFSSITPGTISSADLAVFLAPETSQLEEIKAVTEGLNPKPVVLFNPKWSFEEEDEFGGSLKSFVGSFNVVYSFIGLEVRGILSKRKGLVFRCAKDGIVSGGEGWVVMVEVEEGRKGEFRVVSRFKRRPSISEVENLLYNLMAANSPVTKSVKFLRDLASNVTAKKVK